MKLNNLKQNHIERKGNKHGKVKNGKYIESQKKKKKKKLTMEN